MFKEAHSLLLKFGKEGVFFDTNLMIVLVIGSYDISRLTTFKRTLAFGPPEFRLLMALANRCERRLTTPNILTEVDNLSRQMPSGEHAAVSQHFAKLVSEMFEIYEESQSHLGGELHGKLGLTDAVLIEQAESHLVVTADFPLANRIEAMGRNVINFNHLRPYAE